VEHCQSLLELGDERGAREAYRALLEATLAVGYKDPQLQSWIAWAERANRVDLAGAGKRLATLARLLPWLRDTTDHTGYAPAPLLRAACSLSLETGVALLAWYLERGLFQLAAGIELLMSAALATGPLETAVVTEAVHRHLFLPLDTSASTKVMRDVLQAALAQSKAAAPEVPVMASEAVDRMLAGIAVTALPSTRPALRAAVARVAQTFGARHAVTEEVTPVDDEDRPASGENPAEHLTGPALSLDEARRLVTSVEALRGLLGREKPYSFLHWERVIDAFVARAKRDDVLAIAELFDRGAQSDRQGAILGLLSARLLALGDREGALAMANAAFDAAPQYGWQEQYDGGSKLRALESLARVDRDHARERAWNALIWELESGRVGVASIGTDLHAVVPLLVNEVPAVALWKELGGYLDQLLARTPASDAPVLPEPSGAPAAEVLFTFVARYLEHAAFVLSAGAQRVFVDGLVSGDSRAIASVNACLRDAAGPHHALIMVLTAVGQVSPDLVRPMGEGIERLGASPHFGIRCAARRLLDTIRAAATPSQDRVIAGSPAEEPPGHTITDAVTLPAVYSFAFQPRGEVHRLRQPRTGEPLPPTSDPAEIVGAWRREVDLVARIADVQPEAFYHRIIQIMHTLTGGTSLDTEPDLQRQFERMGLRKAVYRRPRSQLVRRAIFYAVAELVDAGRIGASEYRRVDVLLRDSDPTMLRLRPEPRPSLVSPISERSVSEYSEEDWAGRVTTEPSALNADSAGSEGIVLAEETRLRWLDWKTPTETRVGVRVWVEPSQAALQEAEDVTATLCEEWLHVLVAEYLTHPSTVDHLVILQNGYRFETPGRRWLALSPAVGRALGWRPADHGLFRWLDGEGAMMAESVWWEDGNPDLWPPHFEDEVGSGWLVQVSPKGYEQIAAMRAPLIDCISVRRTTSGTETQQAVLRRQAS
jgi:hypothetical protein